MAAKPDGKDSRRTNNLPVSNVSAFTGDDLAMIFGTYLVDPVFVLDNERGTIVAGNQQFLLLLGLDPKQPEQLDFSWQQMVHPEDRSVFQTWVAADLLNVEGTFEIHLLNSAGSDIPVEINLKNMRWRQREYLIGFTKDVSVQHKRQEQLRRQIQEQKDRAIEAIKSSLSIYQLTEKIKSTPVLTTRLLNVENEQQLFQEAAKVLTSEEGLNYRAVTFLLLEAGVLSVAFSTSEVERKIYPLGENSRFSEFIGKSFVLPESSAGEILLPLRSRGNLMGLCEVLPYSRLKSFFDESGKVGEWQKDVLLTIGDLIALLLDNLRLTREIKRRSITDTLTETYNRYYFVGRLSAEIQRAGRYGRPISVLFMDVDKFKRINDDYGHLQGDQVLRDLGKLFVRNLRQTDVVSRYGGDEFVALLPETDEAMAEETARKLVEAVRCHTFVNRERVDEPLEVSVSIGVNTLRPGESEDAFLKGADEALYRAKQGGRNCLSTRT